MDRGLLRVEEGYVGQKESHTPILDRGRNTSPLVVMVQSVGLIRPAANPVAVKIGVANFPEIHNLVLR